MGEEPTNVVGQRLAAYLIDMAVAIAATVLIWILFTDRLDADSSTGGGFVIGDTRYGFAEGSDGKRAGWGLLSLAAWLAIFVVIPGLRGTSPGRGLTKIRLVKRDGETAGVGRALLRQVLWAVDSLPFLGLVGFVTALTTSGNQRVGDMAAGTYTVKAEYAGRPIAEIVPNLVGPGPIGYGHVPPPQYVGPSPSAPPPAAATTPPPGWYADPGGQSRMRWWDGRRWTDQTSG
jgi:uncharacterized RDD family membrane protein YckC